MLIKTFEKLTQIIKQRSTQKLKNNQKIFLGKVLVWFWKKEGLMMLGTGFC